MHTYYLRFSYQKTMYSVLFDSVTDSEGNENHIPKYNAVEVIGRLYKSPGAVTIDHNGNIEEKPVMQTGFYANVRHSYECPELDQYRVFPLTPERTWA